MYAGSGKREEIANKFSNIRCGYLTSSHMDSGLRKACDNKKMLKGIEH